MDESLIQRIYVKKEWHGAGFLQEMFIFALIALSRPAWQILARCQERKLMLPFIIRFDERFSEH